MGELSWGPGRAAIASGAAETYDHRMRVDAARRARREIASLVHDGLGWLEFTRQFNRVVHGVVPFDSSCFHPLDPSTLLLTGYYSHNLDDEPRLPYHEYAIADVNQWAWMARTRQPVGLLSEATQGELQRSPRFRALMHPRGIRHELRMAFTDPHDAWGIGGLYRNAARSDFDTDEVRFVRDLSPLVAEGMRRAMLTTVSGQAVSPRPGVVIVGRDGEVASVSEPATQMLADVPEEGEGEPREVPLVVRTVAELARRDGGPDGLGARARVLGRSGRWLVFHGSKLAGSEGGQVAVVIEPARPRDTAPLLLAAYRLTAREREVTAQCLAGASTNQIAARLYITPHTVQDHLKAVFEKVGVRSRRELVSRIFDDRVMPHLGTRSRRPLVGSPVPTRCPSTRPDPAPGRVEPRSPRFLGYLHVAPVRTVTGVQSGSETRRRDPWKPRTRRVPTSTSSPRAWCYLGSGSSPSTPTS